MPFNRFVQSGRVALVSDGLHTGKLVAIVDIIDQTRALVDGPNSGVPRQQLRLNQLHLTKFRLSFPFTGKTRVVRKAWNDAKLDEKWSKSQWAQTLDNNAKRADMSDFDRFKLSDARRKRNRIRTPAFRSLKTKAARAGAFGKGRIPKASKVRVKKVGDGKKKAPKK